MKSIITQVVSLVIAIWIVAIAILSVQNATPVALKFFTFQSIQLPAGVILAFAAAVGAISGAAIAPLALSSANPLSDNYESDNEPEEYIKEQPKVNTNVGANDWTERGSKDW